MRLRRPIAAVGAFSAAVVVGCSSTTTAIGGDDSVSASASTSRIGTPHGVVTMQGEILQKYNSVGGSSSPLGTPIADEQSGPEGGRYNKFQLGVIYWTAETGAHIVWGAIRRAWEFDNGGAAGPLGYPTGDEQPIPGGHKQEFQHGTIVETGGQTQVQLR